MVLLDEPESAVSDAYDSHLDQETGFYYYGRRYYICIRTVITGF